MLPSAAVFEHPPGKDEEGLCCHSACIWLCPIVLLGMAAPDAKCSLALSPKHGDEVCCYRWCGHMTGRQARR